MTTTGLVLVVLFLAFTLLAAVAAYRFHRRRGRTEDLTDEGAEAAEYMGLTPGGSG